MGTVVHLLAALVMEVLPRGWLETDAGQAAVAWLWFEGVKQKRIGDAFMVDASRINWIIRDFVAKYVPEKTREISLKRYQIIKPLIPLAIERYRAVS